MRELAEAATRGEGVRLDDSLKARYGKASGAPFGGIVGAANKISRRIAGRDLIARDAAIGGYRMDPLDATVVLVAWSNDSGADHQQAITTGGTTIDQLRRR